MNSQLLWFTTRGAGLISLIGLTGVVILGVMSQARAGSSWWPRFLTPAFHRNLALVTLAFLTTHIITAVVDPFTHLGLVAVVVPFGSYYRTFWLGLGTLACELMLAVLATSLIRRHIGAPLWKAIHYVSYPLWVFAALHGLGTGTDARTQWMLGITLSCLLAFTGAVTWRLLARSAAPGPLLRSRPGLGLREARR